MLSILKKLGQKVIRGAEAHSEHGHAHHESGFDGAPAVPHQTKIGSGAKTVVVSASVAKTGVFAIDAVPVNTFDAGELFGQFHHVHRKSK